MNERSAMRVDLGGSVALVTGAGGAIGKSIALTLAANGAAVVVNDVHVTGAATVEEIQAAGGEAAFVQADISRSAEVREMAASAEQKYGRIDILVNNAGVNTPGQLRRPIHEFDEEEWHRVIGCDLHGTFYCCRAVVPGMVARRYGTIVNIASVMGVVPIRQQIAYAAAKAAVIHLSRSAALELAPYGIRVNVIAPGSILSSPFLSSPFLSFLSSPFLPPSATIVYNRNLTMPIRSLSSEIVLVISLNIRTVRSSSQTICALFRHRC